MATSDVVAEAFQHLSVDTPSPAARAFDKEMQGAGSLEGGFRLKACGASAPLDEASPDAAAGQAGRLEPADTLLLPEADLAPAPATADGSLGPAVNGGRYDEDLVVEPLQSRLRAPEDNGFPLHGARRAQFPYRSPAGGSDGGDGDSGADGPRPGQVADAEQHEAGEEAAEQEAAQRWQQQHQQQQHYQQQQQPQQGKAVLGALAVEDGLSADEDQARGGSQQVEAADDQDEEAGPTAAPAPAHAEADAAPAAEPDADAEGDAEQEDESQAASAAAPERSSVRSSAVKVTEMSKQLKQHFENGMPFGGKPKEPETSASGGGVTSPRSAAARASGGAFLTQHDLVNTANVAQVLQAGEFKLKPGVDVVPYAELKELRLEDGLDVSRKEEYLSEEEFEVVFGMDKEDFQAMPPWKRINAKKAKGLF
ncbi:hypothetical protein MNEG_6435 [Monoraphidium neglectum]|uniref:HP domain-containing protein n=1 Tax=Monoraphidium neglectum TaxID=145388 RepID=A0A0D2L2N9_9CHLO|nr:hypothetical protein MNEG_6435 [Monoraphidium neglectum]KIZ01524.1 hypothetical protein MNEG_6435 [Monoraphidium neglectum]|eukprot:XP_013900543.1 hypothetical protein MNEG_6435 [Monoraphidium neglectum]